MKLKDEANLAVPDLVEARLAVVSLSLFNPHHLDFNILGAFIDLLFFADILLTFMTSVQTKSGKETFYCDEIAT